MRPLTPANLWTAQTHALHRLGLALNALSVHAHRAHGRISINRKKRWRSCAMANFLRLDQF